MKEKQKENRIEVPRIFGNYHFDSGTTKQVMDLERAINDMKKRIRRL